MKKELEKDVESCENGQFLAKIGEFTITNIKKNSFELIALDPIHCDIETDGNECVVAVPEIYTCFFFSKDVDGKQYVEDEIIDMWKQYMHNAENKRFSPTGRQTRNLLMDHFVEIRHKNDA